MRLEQFAQKLFNTINPKEVIQQKCNLQDTIFSYSDQLQLDLNNYQRIFVLSLGKAACAMAQGFYQVLNSSPKLAAEKLPKGLAVTKHGHGSESPYYQVIEASHPYCDNDSLKAGQSIKSFLEQLAPDDLLLVGISGGGSALAVLPHPHFNLEEKTNIGASLLKGGATIEETNKIRSELSLLKNGGMASLTPANKIISFVISDVPSNDLSIISSGPFFYQKREVEELKEIAQRFLAIDAQSKLLPYLQLPERQEAIAHKEQVLRNKEISHFIISDSKSMQEEAAKLLPAYYPVEQLSFFGPVINETIETGIQKILNSLRALVRQESSWAFISGGEMPITVKGDGKGGRNTEFVLQMSKLLFLDNVLQLPSSELKKLEIISVATDGGDGPTEHAGGRLNFKRLQEATMNGFDLEDYLKRNDSLSFLQKTGSALQTGPSGTNVMDLRIIIKHKI